MNKVDLEYLKSWFAGYCRTFYTGNEVDDRNIALKEEHTGRVCANILRIGRSEGLDDNGLLLAETIALIHDVGRFPQYRRYKTFMDSISTNHARLGGEVLREERPLDKLPKHEQVIVIRGVCLHNVFALPGHLDEESAFFLKLVRDADKLDIWRVFIDHFALPEAERASAVALGFDDSAGCSPEVLDYLERREMASLSLVRNLNDFKLLQLSWLYDLNFSASFRIAHERGLIGSLAATLPREREISRAVEGLIAHLEEKCHDGRNAAGGYR